MLPLTAWMRASMNTLHGSFSVVNRILLLEENKVTACISGPRTVFVFSHENCSKQFLR